jgi:tellurite resistance protein TehA-like permease
MSGQTARNIGILVALALVVAFAPAGGEGADIVGKVLNAAFIVVTALIVGRLYRQFRGEIFGLGDQWRCALYVAVGLAIVTVSITGRMWDTGAGAAVWVAVIGACSYTLYVIWQRYRSYT